jgi:histidinol phosphatase-like PHP family hydrolase
MELAGGADMWTRERMLKVIRTAARNHIAVEINSKYNIPRIAFLKLAKQAGCRFSLGSNRHDAEPGGLDYSIHMAKELGLTAQDMYLPAGKQMKQDKTKYPTSLSGRDGNVP